jgi:DNA-binding MarR family transcriptional regulator
MIKKNMNASVIFNVIALSEAWKKNGDLLTKNFGITTQQWFILLFLANDPNIVYLQQRPKNKPLMASELADALNVSRANITNLLNVLIEKKLIEQKEDSADRRRKHLKLTKQGERIVKQLEEVRHDRNEKMLSRFSTKEKEQFIAFTEQCLKMLGGR